ncbi:hypothetical protein KC321_g18979, partial [Hortaea werneckii]
MTQALWRCWRNQSVTLRGIKPFSTSAVRREIRTIEELPERQYPSFKETSRHDLLALQWPSPPRNILFVRKDDDQAVHEALLEYIRHVRSSYPETNLIFEPHVARQLHEAFDFPCYTIGENEGALPYHDKVDLTSTLGGDGTILHAASLFATARSVPPVLSFSMGTLGFLGEWKFAEYKRAFREVFVSGAPDPLPAQHSNLTTCNDGGAGPNST